MYLGITNARALYLKLGPHLTVRLFQRKRESAEIPLPSLLSKFNRSSQYRSGWYRYVPIRLVPMVALMDTFELKLEKNVYAN